MIGPRDGDMQNLHRNKRTLTLDLKSEAGNRVLRRLVQDADVVVENFRPDVKQRLGIDYDTLAGINRASFSPASRLRQMTYRERPGFDQVAQGMSGLMSVTGQPGGPPMRAGAAVVDVAAGLFAALGVLTALVERERSGRGQWVQSSLLHAGIALMTSRRHAIWSRRSAGQVGNDHPPACRPRPTLPPTPYQRRGCRPPDVANALPHDRREDLLARSEFNDEAGRAKHRTALNAELAATLRTRTSAQWIEALNAAGIPCGPIYRMHEVFADPQVKHLGVAAPVTHRRWARSP